MLEQPNNNPYHVRTAGWMPQLWYIPASAPAEKDETPTTRENDNNVSGQAAKT
jgi:hypothetical protein